MYRASRFCPGCQTAAMRQLSLPSRDGPVEVELCDGCGCFYVEFFDGELTRLARALVPFLHPREQRSRPPGEPRCPDCDVPFTLQPYAERELLLRRCPSCLSAFLTSEEVGSLARPPTED